MKEIVVLCTLFAVTLFVCEYTSNKEDARWRESGYVWVPHTETPGHWEKSK